MARTLYQQDSTGMIAPLVSSIPMAGGVTAADNIIYSIDLNAAGNIQIGDEILVIGEIQVTDPTAFVQGTWSRLEISTAANTLGTEISPDNGQNNTPDIHHQVMRSIGRFTVSDTSKHYANFVVYANSALTATAENVDQAGYGQLFYYLFRDDTPTVADALDNLAGAVNAAIAGSTVGVTSQQDAEAGTNNIDMMTALRCAQAIAAQASGAPPVPCGRLTLTTATPVTISDVTAATTLYYTPYNGNSMQIYDGSAWRPLTFGEVSIAIPATTSTLYDVFGYNNNGTLTLELLAWTNDTTRATTLTRLNGALVKTGDFTRRYLGNMRTTGTSGQTEDSKAKRYVFNHYNRCKRLMQALDSAASWTYSTATWRQANANTANQIDFIIGWEEEPVQAMTSAQVLTSGATIRFCYTGIGLDSTTAATDRYSSIGTHQGYQNIQAYYDGFPGIGRHYLAQLEQGGGTDTQTWAGGTRYGIKGWVLG